MPNSPPILEVSHLPSAASFYASIAQPLGIHYLFSTPPSSPLALLHYGNPSTKEIIFSLTPSPVPRAAKIYLPASTSKAVIDFQKISEQANPRDNTQGIRHTQGDEGEEVVCCAEDWDGNMIEVTFSERKEEGKGSRVAEWQEDVARSTAGSGAGPGNLKRAETFPRGGGGLGGGLMEEKRPEAKRSVSGGISRGTVIGTLLGAAAGAALAYAMVRSESPQPVPEPPAYEYSRGEHGYRRDGYGQEEGVVEHIPATSRVGSVRQMERVDVRPRYVERYTTIPELGRGGDGPRELETIAEGSYISTRSRRSKKAESHYERPLAILPALEAREGSHVSRREEGSHVSRRSERDEGSHVSHRSHRSSGSRRSSGGKKERSEAGGGGKEESFHTARSDVTVKPATTVYVAAPASHVSSRSRREKSGETVVKVGGSAVSVRPSRVALPESVVEGSRSGRSKSGKSRVDDGASRASKSRSGKSRSGRSRHGHDEYDEYATFGAERVELPDSVVGGGNYEASVAPSDSVSCVGSKMERLRLVERMRKSANYVGR
ncbi:hypothetical protein GLAREA_10017 [Glarea lozoyensis ATCC 20868]|uniref:VOC domain-containing protein n=1 Tax=Glarea lozoyensis (strain ATCC 20868 / MF5171) TaxID=1116229 RepID=S3E7N4_GLAL2|nr:uncharacterized protein GLAREA_10017 [Glarea lozoyensis ATCC 20868]EPE34323.1 hypothetical protein GLAREA_10017 [Glarea lozoyensis ATCC 20868]